jgi:hypothetical protein
MEDSSLIDTAGDVVGLAIFAGVAGLAIGGVKKITKKIKREDDNEVKWF